jgi:SpoVK/Ycf46/Vps4 family AAA+-type ATPase
MSATNAIWDIDPSLMRYGRLDHQVFVAPPNEYDRALFFAHKFENYGLKIASFDELVSKSELFSFADLEKLFSDSVKIHLESSLSANKKRIPQLEISSVLKVLNKSNSSIRYWFELFKQESDAIFKKTEIYDTVMNYISAKNL